MTIEKGVRVFPLTTGENVKLAQGWIGLVELEMTIHRGESWDFPDKKNSE